MTHEIKLMTADGVRERIVRNYCIKNITARHSIEDRYEVYDTLTNESWLMTREEYDKLTSTRGVGNAARGRFTRIVMGATTIVADKPDIAPLTALDAPDLEDLVLDIDSDRYDHEPDDTWSDLKDCIPPDATMISEFSPSNDDVRNEVYCPEPTVRTTIAPFRYDDIVKGNSGNAQTFNLGSVVTSIADNNMNRSLNRATVERDTINNALNERRRLLENIHSDEEAIMLEIAELEEEQAQLEDEQAAIEHPSRIRENQHLRGIKERERYELSRSFDEVTDLIAEYDNDNARANERDGRER